jgi:large subunit ribosomal protein L13
MYMTPQHGEPAPTSLLSLPSGPSAAVPQPRRCVHAHMLPQFGGPLRLLSRGLYSLAEHQHRALQQAGRLPSKFRFTRGKPRVDKRFVEPERAWILMDGYGEVMGRLASRIVPLLMGKHKPIYQAHRDVGDHVVVVNAAYVVVGDKAMKHKNYDQHSGYPGGLKVTPLSRLFEQNPTEPLRRAIFGMLPKNRLRHQRMSRLRLYPAGGHAQEAAFRDFHGKAFRARLPASDGAAVLERIRPAADERDTE